MLLAVLPVVLLAACTTTEVVRPAPCSLAEPTVDPAEATPGETVRVTTHPLTDAYDTVVTVGSGLASVVELDREDCDDCDDCRTEQACTSCTDCDACASECDRCEESVVIVVPEVGNGEQAVLVTNSRGSSPPGTLVVYGVDTARDSGAQ
jgi:hypothetical protein